MSLMSIAALIVAATSHPLPAGQAAPSAFAVDHGPKVVSQGLAEYPPIAISACVQGTVPVVVRVGADGKVVDTDVIHGHVLLRRAAEEAARRWLFVADDGQPDRRQVVRYVFRLMPAFGQPRDPAPPPARSWGAEARTDVEVRSAVAHVFVGGRLDGDKTMKNERKCLGTGR